MPWDVFAPSPTFPDNDEQHIRRQLIRRLEVLFANEASSPDEVLIANWSTDGPIMESTAIEPR